MRSKRKWCQACHRSVVGTKRVQALGFKMNLCQRCQVSARAIDDRRPRRMHLAISFVGGCPATKCGRYVDSDHVSAYKAEITCKSCLD